MRRVLLAVALAGCLVAGCGVPFDESPRAIDPGRVPFGLLDPDSVTSTTVAPSSRVGAEIFLVRSDRLAAVNRDVAAPATPQKLLTALLQGPTDVEATSNLRTAITTTAGVTAADPEDGLVRIELGRSFTTSGASDQVLAFAQLVFTASSVPGVTRVTFTVSGRPVEVPTGDGTLTGTPLARGDFAGVAP